ncbi:Protein CBG06796 [Caenorhabditis briggsae]|uniref:Protein CBG06796 n=1 Tax=Caenorhabditis briggsae TaxID=6238 RepID=A8X335_CAEBR|nr:Protein CBG06796 [Caenorhabditis briggsae]CAP27045.1 Protein CBG06796 [Caenorhabditis briggsae]
MPMPREILDAILLKWSVKSVILKFVDVTRQDIQKRNWIKSKWFTGFRFNDVHEAVNPSSLDLKFPKVEVDFEVDIQLVVSDKKKIYFAHSDEIKKNDEVLKYKLRVTKEIPPDVLLKCRKYNETTGLYCYRHELHAGIEMS